MTQVYLVQYGRSAFVGPFGGPVGVAVGRGDAVVVRSPRGVELGTVLGPADPRFVGGLDPTAGGSLLRPAGPADRAAAEDANTVGADLLAAADKAAAAAGLPLVFLDAEVLLDGPAVLHAVAWDACDADGLFADLGERFGRPVRLLDVGRTPVAADPPAKGCGKPGCGSGAGGCSSCGTGGGCGTGSCSKGSVKSADELTAYFAGLRTRMEAGGRRTPLH